MAKLNVKKGNETKSYNFPRENFKSDVICFLCEEISKYFNDFQFQHNSILWLRWTHIIEMKQSQTFFMRYIQVWHHVSFVRKLKNISMTFIICISQFNCEIDIKQAK